MVSASKIPAAANRLCPCTGTLIVISGTTTIQLHGYLSTTPNDGANVPSILSLESVRPVTRDAAAVSDRTAISNPATSLGRVSALGKKEKKHNTPGTTTCYNPLWRMAGLRRVWWLRRFWLWAIGPVNGDSGLGWRDIQSLPGTDTAGLWLVKESSGLPGQTLIHASLVVPEKSSCQPVLSVDC